MKNGDIIKRWNEIRSAEYERYLQLRGVDVKEVRKLQEEINGEYDKLAQEVRRTLEKEGLEIAKLHEASLERKETLIQSDTEKMAQLPEGVYEWLRKPAFTFRCCTPFKATFKRYEDEKSGNPGVTETVNYEATGNIAHPFVEIINPGAGKTSIAQLNTRFVFAFTPTTDMIYCINPLVYMNGHWAIWTWGSCSNNDVGSGLVRVTLRVAVYQLNVPVKQTELKVVDQTALSGGHFKTGFNYDSTVQDGAGVSTYLQGGDQAVVEVDCEIYGQLTNFGRIWVDMQTSPGFYFKVPELYWGWPIPWPLAP
jgi:hypothetical protein